jgi:hypothetical protein
MLAHKKILFSLALVLLVIAVPFVVSAVPLNDVQNVASNGGLANYTSAGTVLVTVLNAILAMAFLVAVIFVVISGYRMIVSQGNEQQVASAKQNLLWTILGIVLIVCAWVILTVVMNVIKTGQP